MRVTTQILQNQATITPQTLQGLHSLSEINKAFEQASLAPMVEKIVFDLPVSAESPGVQAGDG